MSPPKNDEIGPKQALVVSLYETHFERVTRYIAVRIGDITEAEDLASEVFMRALQAVGSYQEKGVPIEAWLFRIAHNIVVDHLRKKSRRPTLPLDEALSLPGKDKPGEELEQQQEREELRRAMEQLSPAQQQVLALRLEAEMTSKQVAQVMGKKPGAIRQMQSSAVKKLRDLLKK